MTSFMLSLEPIEGPEYAERMVILCRVVPEFMEQDSFRHKPSTFTLQTDLPKPFDCLTLEKIGMPLSRDGIDYVLIVRSEGKTVGKMVLALEPRGHACGIKQLKAPRQCSQCGKSGKLLKKCSECKYVLYCDSKCQRDDWTYHRGTCIGLQQFMINYASIMV